MINKNVAAATSPFESITRTVDHDEVGRDLAYPPSKKGPISGRRVLSEISFSALKVWPKLPVARDRH
jgi:hypothetical protein